VQPVTNKDETKRKADKATRFLPIMVVLDIIGKSGWCCKRYF